MHSTFAIDGEGGPRPPIDTLHAAGEAEVLGADYWEDPIVGLIAGDVEGHSNSKGAPHKEPGVCDAAAVLHIANRVIYLDNAAVNSPSLGIQGNGIITLDNQLDLQLVAVPIGNLQAAIKQSVPSIVGEVAGDIVGVVQGAIRSAAGSLLYQYRITGSTSNPQKQLVPAPVLSDTSAFLFGQMAQQKNGDLLTTIQSAPGSKPPAPKTKPATATPVGKSKGK